MLTPTERNGGGRIISPLFGRHVCFSFRLNYDENVYFRRTIHLIRSGLLIFKFHFRPSVLDRISRNLIPGGGWGERLTSSNE